MVGLADGGADLDVGVAGLGPVGRTHAQQPGIVHRSAKREEERRGETGGGA